MNKNKENTEKKYREIERAEQSRKEKWNDNDRTIEKIKNYKKQGGLNKRLSKRNWENMNDINESLN
jgi:alcohol dehydrogenase class IV